MIFNKKSKIEKKQKEFLRIYNDYSGEIYRFCMFRLRNKEDAEDITAETFIKFYSQDFNRIREKRAWLFKACRNIIYDKFYRPTSRNKVVMKTDNTKMDDQKPSGEDLEILVLEDHTLELIREEIDRFRDKSTADIIVLKVWEQLSFKEISKITGLQESTVKQRYYRGLDEIKAKLASKNRKNKRLKAITIPLVVAGIAKLGATTQFGITTASAATISSTVSTALGISLNVAAAGAAGTAAGVAVATTTGATSSAAVGTVTSGTAISTAATGATISTGTAAATVTAGAAGGTAATVTGSTILGGSSAQIIAAAVGTTALVGGGIGTASFIATEPEIINEPEIQQIVTEEIPLDASENNEDNAIEDEISDSSSQLNNNCINTYSNSILQFEYDECIWTVSNDSVEEEKIILTENEGEASFEMLFIATNEIEEDIVEENSTCIDSETIYNNLLTIEELGDNEFSFNTVSLDEIDTTCFIPDAGIVLANADDSYTIQIKATISETIPLSIAQQFVTDLINTNAENQVIAEDLSKIDTITDEPSETEEQSDLEVTDSEDVDSINVEEEQEQNIKEIIEYAGFCEIGIPVYPNSNNPNIFWSNTSNFQNVTNLNNYAFKAEFQLIDQSTTIHASLQIECTQQGEWDLDEIVNAEFEIFNNRNIENDTERYEVSLSRAGNKYGISGSYSITVQDIFENTETTYVYVSKNERIYRIAPFEVSGNYIKEINESTANIQFGVIKPVEEVIEDTPTSSNIEVKDQSEGNDITIEIENGSDSEPTQDEVNKEPE